MTKKKSEKRKCKPKLTPGERLIWAAAYALEFQRWTIGSSPVALVEIKAARAALAQATLAVLSARAAVAYLDNGRICERPMRPAVQACARQILHPKAFLGVKVKRPKREKANQHDESFVATLNEVIAEQEKRSPVEDAKAFPPPPPKFRASANRPKRIS